MRIAWLLAVLAASGCQDDPCSAACKRVAQCKQNQHAGSEPMLGERAPPPDRRCMDRCTNKKDDFQRCEAAQRTCADLRGCLGKHFDD